MRPIGTECSPDKRSAIRENAGHKKALRKEGKASYRNTNSNSG
jgi:hypothetical protein